MQFIHDLEEVMVFLHYLDKIVYELTLGEATKSHSRNLSPKKCREIGLKIKFIEEDEELQDLILSIHHACMNYFNQKNASKIYLNQNGIFLSNYIE